MAKGLVRRDNLAKDTLLGLATAGAFIIAATSPFFLTRFLEQYFNDKIKRIAQKRAERLREFEKKKLVSFKELRDGSVKIELTHQGKLLVRHYKLDELKINKQGSWDKRWRLIFYDIPEYKKKARDAFGKKMKDLGLYRLQKSLWVSAYDCLAEIEFLCSVFEIDMDDVLYLEVANIPKDREVRKWFEL